MRSPGSQDLRPLLPYHDVPTAIAQRGFGGGLKGRWARIHHPSLSYAQPITIHNPAGTIGVLLCYIAIHGRRIDVRRGTAADHVDVTVWRLCDAEISRCIERHGLRGKDDPIDPRARCTPRRPCPYHRRL